jgi:hypothetical protein
MIAADAAIGGALEHVRRFLREGLFRLVVASAIADSLSSTQAAAAGALAQKTWLFGKMLSVPTTLAAMKALLLSWATSKSALGQSRENLGFGRFGQDILRQTERDRH